MRIVNAWAYLTAVFCVCVTTTLLGGVMPPISGAERRSNGAPTKDPLARGSATDGVIKYIGPGSCAATSCHGSVKPVAGSRILQDEYSTWILRDKHSRAYQALTGEVGERMAQILKLGAKAEEAPKCLACHALYTTAERRGRAF